ncbi:hypothetical protein ABXS75_03665 [Roseburia hominis]
MKKVQINQMASRQAGADSPKKYPMFGILVLCLLLAFGIVISLVFLGSSIGQFSRKDTNVISLVPPEAAYSESEGKATADISEFKEKPAQEESSVAGSTTSPRHTAGTTSYIAGQSDEYQGELQVYDDVQIWNSETHVDLFRNSYDGTVKSDDEEKVIAPGTSNFYDFTLKNNGNIPLDYAISLRVDTYLGEEETYSAIPLEWRLLAGDGTAVSDWREYNERTEVLRQATLDIRHQDNYTVEWRWAFERGEGMDESDTDMGNLAVNQPLGVNATIYVYAEQSASWDGKTPSSWKVPKTGDPSNILFYIVLTAVSACGLLMVLWVRGKKDKEIKDGKK